MYNFLHVCIGLAHLLYMNECICCYNEIAHFSALDTSQLLTAVRNCK